MKKSINVMLWASTALVLAFAFSPYWSPFLLASNPGTTASPATDEKQIVLGIEGMTCDTCSRNVEAALSKVDGVRSASVSYANRQAVVTAAAAVTEEALARAVEGAGYRTARSSSPAKAEAAVPAPTPVTVLESTLTPLIDQFNGDRQRPRVLALLSPT